MKTLKNLLEMYEISGERKRFYLEEKGLSEKEDTIFEKVSSQAIVPGTGYRRDFYQEVGGDLGIAFACKPSRNPAWCIDEVFSVSQKKAEKVEYAHECGRAARKHCLPFEVVLSIGPELAPALAEAYSDAVIPLDAISRIEDDLSAGINRRKDAIIMALGLIEGTPMHTCIKHLGQNSSKRVAKWLLDIMKY